MRRWLERADNWFDRHLWIKLLSGAVLAIVMYQFVMIDLFRMGLIALLVVPTYIAWAVLITIVHKQHYATIARHIEAEFREE